MRQNNNKEYNTTPVDFDPFEETLETHAHTFPLTESQQEIWLASQMSDTASCAFNESFTITFAGPFRMQAMQQAIQKVFERHDIFHVKFSPDGFYQKKSDAETITITCEDFSSLSETEKEEKLQEVFEHEASTPFDLVNGPLLRTRLIILQEKLHKLIITGHHIILDGWSRGIILDELSIIYSSFCQDKPYTLLKALSFRDYAMKQETAYKTPKADKAKQYWLKQFSAMPTPLQLPTDKPRPSIKTYNGNTVSFSLDQLLSQHIKRAAMAQGTTLHTYLYTVYSILLAKLSGQKDIVVGIPFAGQAIAGQNSLVGLCVNLLPIRVTINAHIKFKDLLTRVRSLILDAYDHHQTTFGTIVQNLKISRDPSRLPLVDVSFNLALDIIGGLDFYNVKTSIQEVPKRAINFDIHLNISDINGQLVFDCNYNTDLFTKETIVRWLKHYTTLLEGFIANPEQHVGKVPLLTREEVAHYNHAWNNTAKDYSYQGCLHTLFEQQAARTPDATAVSFNDEKLTYSELNNRANYLASKLRSSGVRAGEPIGICMERSLEMIIALLACLKAGGAYVPIDPELPAKRISYILQDIDPPIILTQKRVQTLLPQNATHIYCLDTDQGLKKGHPVPLPDIEINESSPAYIIYTSGSTGNPKGVVIPHKGICNRLLWMQEEFRLTAHDTVLQKTPYSFDVSVWEFFWPLITGAHLRVAIPGGHKDNAYMIKEITSHNITVIHFVPSMLQAFIDQPEVEQCTDLRYVICSGEALSYRLQKRFFEKINARLYNLYGPTEASVDVTCWKCQKNYPRQIVPIGKPIANTCIYILDEYLHTMPIGIIGELHIAGRGLASSYLNKPALTSEKFIPNPFEEGTRLYKTGDLVRRLPDGNIEFIGRKDFQIQIRGFRVELEEIEQNLLQHPAVKDTIVIVKEQTHEDKRLVAYIIAHGTQAIDINDIREFARATLPQHMIPSFFVEMNAFPLTASGKIDRNALPMPDIIRPHIASHYIAPRNEMEHTIADIWQDILNIDKVGVFDNFFDLGGHSLLITRVHRILEKITKKEISVVDMFKYPTITSLAQYINQGTKNVNSMQKIKNRAKKQKEVLNRQKKLSQQEESRDNNSRK